MAADRRCGMALLGLSASTSTLKSFVAGGSAEAESTAFQ
jgi:hypothetical protein